MAEEEKGHQIMELKFLISFISSGIFLFLAGCTKTTEEPFSCDAEVDLVIEDCNELAKHVTVPIAVLTFTDEREFYVHENEYILDQSVHEETLMYSKGCKWQECVVQDFNQVITKAFEAALQCSGATIADADNASLFLSGKINKFMAWACVRKTVKKYSWEPLEVVLELKDANDIVVWTKTATVKDIKFRTYAKNQSLKSQPEIIFGYLYLVRRGEDWTMKDAVLDCTQKCISSAFNDLVTDETFWNAVEP
jgi:hypothetical protein